MNNSQNNGCLSIIKYVFLFVLVVFLLGRCNDFVHTGSFKPSPTSAPAATPAPTVLKVAPTFFFSCIASCTPCRTLSHAVRIIHAKLTRRATIFALSRKCSRPNSFQVIPKFPPTNTKSPGRPHGSSPYHPPGLSHCVLLLALMLHSALDDLAQ